jgi:hypothetical protein
VTYIDSLGNKVVKKQDEHIGKTIKDLAGPINQWHIRAYDIDTNDDIKVVGQVHHDPWDHGKWPIKEIDVIPRVEYKAPDWSFSEGRRLVSDEWKSWGSGASVPNLGNGSHWKSSDGKLAKIDRS